MPSVCFTLFSILLIATLPNFQGYAASDLYSRSSSPFSVALETLQKQLGYSFNSTGLLRRAMTHASFSEENNRGLSILGACIMQKAVLFQLLSKDIDISSRDLNRRIAEISKVESACTGDGLRLGLHKVVRVSPKTNSSAPSVVCGAFRAIFGAIAIDAANYDAAGNVFWAVHGSKGGVALPF
ncbi:protein NUCLEAR FUSION DEFECTIVE 2 [Prosopis cineraria]|uniref:protein NUCLEAR FUSION DEFECTIVE 2 n=1 Tax=Prosopis cineraria TaxID=364024 RepID=UPI00240F230E|nr:protein NUCLEAR FUSION DEFECTIVE 2 [Prosopis cineraria]XP_054806407.1 protein NUCLEAR FUSION DEFECTIVE 2 [Prosopis cineraria]